MNLQLVLGTKRLIDYFYWDLYKGDYEHTIRHELRHHFDRRFLLYRGECMRGKPSFNLSSDGKPESVNNSNYILEYLFDLRGEGFADFRRDFLEGIHPSIHIDSINHNSSLKDKVDFLFTCLELETENVVSVFEYFEQNSGLLWSDWFDNIYSTKYTLNQNDLGLTNTFSPYVQGVHLFNIIALAEIAREYHRINKRPIKFKSLFENNEIPEHVYKRVSRKVAGVRTLREFYDLFYKSAENIGLEEHEDVVPKEYVERYVRDF